ncbi:PTS sugar transporter subunit IIA [Franconibacter daqui]|uniref:PTS sugar transporter subunit IIA n=1 Tax=Franconibacter daqui TaxID=2047724 RepID=UPI002DBF20D0|nr:PTS sugar transporter subunit IIA [Franconibacter daqui]MEB5923844.1 PTS sugar transporter subunit IIA [Franconibacter daqui]
MLGWVIVCRGYAAQEMQAALEEKAGALAQCRAVDVQEGLSANMLSRMLCDALHETDSGDGVIFFTEENGGTPYRTAALLSHKHPHCEVISGVTVALLGAAVAWRETLTSESFRLKIVEQGGENVSSLWHQQQKNPPFVLKHAL